MTATAPDLIDGQTPYETARVMHEFGWKPFPLDHPSLPQCAGIGRDHDPKTCDERGKHPCVAFTTATRTINPKILAMWFSEARNVGIFMGGSGLAVIDEDQPDALAKYAADHGVTIPNTFKVKTGKGQHYYFQAPEGIELGNEEGALGPYGINVRSGNAYVVGPGSRHANGATYEADTTYGPAPWPDWLTAAIKASRHGHTKTNDDGAPFEDAGGFDPFELSDVIKEGQRDSILYRFACSLRAQDLNMNTALLLMRAAWERCQQPPDAKTRYEWQTAVGKLHNAYGRYDSGRSEGYGTRQANGEQRQDSRRHLKATKASDIAMTATRWLWEDEHGCWIPMGALVGLGGREGVGKSTVCAHLAAQITNGKLPGDFYGIPKGVIIVSTEDDWSATIKPRLAAAGADLDRAFQVKSIEPGGLEGTLSLPEDMKRLEELIREHDVALIILDPLLTMVNAKLDTHKDAEVRIALEPVVAMAHAARASLVGLVHVNKSNEGDLLNRIMASRALTSVPRGFLFCASYKPMEMLDPSGGEDPYFAELHPGRQEFLFGQIKNNLAAKVMISHHYHMETVTVGYDAEAKKDIKASRLVIHGLIALNVEDIVLEQEKKRRSVRTQGAKAETWLVGFLAGKGEVPSSWVINAGGKAGYSKDAVQRARSNLGDRVVVTSLPVVPRSTTWRLLEE